MASPYKFNIYIYIYIIDDHLHFVCISLPGRKCFLNKNYKINKSLNFNTVLCVSAYRDMEGTQIKDKSGDLQLGKQ